MAADCEFLLRLYLANRIVLTLFHLDPRSKTPSMQPSVHDPLAYIDSSRGYNYQMNRNALIPPAAWTQDYPGLAQAAMRKFGIPRGPGSVISQSGHSALSTTNGYGSVSQNQYERIYNFGGVAYGDFEADEYDDYKSQSDLYEFAETRSQMSQGNYKPVGQCPSKVLTSFSRKT